MSIYSIFHVFCLDYNKQKNEKINVCTSHKIIININKMSKQNLEIELKFLLDSLPEFIPTRIYDIEQIYLDKKCFSDDLLRNIIADYGLFDDIAEIRIRKKTNLLDNNVDNYFFTIKTQGDITRGEYEVEISPEQYVKLQNEIKIIGSLTKRRYVKKIDDLTYEIDEYTNVHNGLIILEVELPNEHFVIDDIVRKICESFKITNIKDVTCDKKYKNKNLAMIC
jgi:CYTH domain-containing protein